MRIKTTFVLLLVVSLSYCQDKEFEGIINYEIEFKNPSPEIMNDSIWKKRVGKTISNHKYYYKKGNYKNIIDNNKLQIYKQHADEIYNYVIERDTIFSNILKVNNSIDPIKSIEKNSDLKLILDYKCNKVTFKTKFTETTYYYSKKLFMSSENYINHHYGNWYEYLKETNAIPLKIITKNKFLHMEMTAIDVDEIELSLKEFELPTDRSQKE